MFNKSVTDLLSKLTSSFDQIPMERKQTLLQLGEMIRSEISSKGHCDLITICTHNSRRSHIAQIWFEVGSKYYLNGRLSSFSGGTESTRLHENTFQALRSCGFDITQETEGENPMFGIRYTLNDDMTPSLFSKVYSHEVNPQENYVAVLVCDNAVEACPVVIGAAQKIAVTFTDPKKYDHSAEAVKKYCESVENIGREILFALSNIVD